MSALKPIKVWGIHGPNSAKVVILCEELGLPYELDPIPLSDVKDPRYVAINPNGRVPAIEDPNTDIKLWESGAIIEYLTETYDKSLALSFTLGTPDSYHARQWLFYQTTGQGPYYGQSMWFIIYQPIQEARDRYVKEVNRVTGVLEGHLAKQEPDVDGNAWFLGSRFSYVDIAFLTWQNTVGQRIPDAEFNQDNHPHVKKWMDNLLTRPSVQKVLKLQEVK
ncbi:Glutathione S-transferase-like protein [Hapsidospora chrysogenum ATCC 11550]|uniref:Glutathione S-transferase-like protein n=1 Tax=Hapsidospora chrysogenum (strain ATCC 11550 / CBS 779.69 / DSM 880 / IAM 14645 / JCM 23072 / IMI 49137) TaxID=857340 RepID=A0A086SXX3_HAPC1|nr:Glutathione S-transferase-like protein [Hapsidospora chrysogenum ATCC 11550]